MASPRPSHQRWIKRPPRPSRPVAPRQPARTPPGAPQLVMALGAGLLLGLLGALAGPALLPRPGSGGLFAGLGFVLGFLILWRSFGGTRQDIRDMFR